jgi:hypothetical protein
LWQGPAASAAGCGRRGLRLRTLTRRASTPGAGLTTTVLQCLYRLESWGWLESWWEDRQTATHDGRPPRRFYRLTGVGQREATALLAERFKGQLRFAPGGGVG